MNISELIAKLEAIREMGILRVEVCGSDDNSDGSFGLAVWKTAGVVRFDETVELNEITMCDE